MDSVITAQFSLVTGKQPQTVCKQVGVVVSIKFYLQNQTAGGSGPEASLPTTDFNLQLLHVPHKFIVPSVKGRVTDEFQNSEYFRLLKSCTVHIHYLTPSGQLPVNKHISISAFRRRNVHIKQNRNSVVQLFLLTNLPQTYDEAFGFLIFLNTLK